MHMTLAEPTTRKWTRAEYYQLGELGFFQDERVELIDGEIIEMAPQNNQHAMVVGLVQELLSKIFPECWVRVQLPLFISDETEPEPDIAVVTGKPRTYPDDHPRTALLIVEVSDSSVRYDRRKSGIYAAAGIKDLWLINIVERQVETHRNPIADSSQPHGHRYADVKILKSGDSIAPLAKLDQPIAVADLLP
jgi:Uma2 family endonuclease